MNRMILLIGAICISYAGQSQKIREVRMTVGDQNQFAMNVEVPFEQKILDAAWNQKTTDLNIKGKSVKGIMAYEKVKIFDLHFETITLYVKSEKSEKIRSQITIAIAKESGEFMTDKDDKMIKNLENFLIAFYDYSDQYKLKLDIKDLEDNMKKAQKDQEKLVEEGKKLQQQLEKNQTDQEAKTKEIQMMQSGLEQLRQKLK